MALVAFSVISPLTFCMYIFHFFSSICKGMAVTDVGVDMHVGTWVGIGEDTYSVSLLLSSFAFPYSMVFGCIQKNLHCYIQLALDICYISGNSFLCSVVLFVFSAYFFG